MSRSNPLVVEVVRGLAGSGPAQVVYLGCLGIQALALFLWWPRRELFQSLANESGPNALLAVVIALGLTLAYYSARAGAEEFLLAGQQPLCEWAVSTPLPLPRVLRGYLIGHLVQTLHALALSSPLLLTAFSVGGGEWPVLGWSLVTIALLATCFRLVGAVLYLAIGHYDVATHLSLRALLLVGYAATPVLYPPASHFVVSYRLMDDPSSLHLVGATLPDHIAFALVYAGLSAVFTIVLYRLLSDLRRKTGGEVLASTVVSHR